ncbi:hypothetical protein CHLRE_18g748397v5 [Chlamydomonas reinhardtii]|uniref:Uncharacterized protein n=1 Tax=Chlamydomonas reinhardtii TaxID=3055 RepID=A0A2K3CNG5_CHLRE|nr:uncharacterized protein CHLRE_18g748397v5 [Chlamydomonas reinhardtii]PNW69832.1 hypothetical protein CHLRE_18g748397v5 [Chlamydomonas reinhardtii]
MPAWGSARSWRQHGAGTGSAWRRGRLATVALATGSAAAEPAASTPKNLMEGDIVSPKREAKLTLEQYKEIYDRLIDIFQTRPRDDWKKLIVFSKQWDEHATGVFDRIKEKAEAEADLDKKMALRKLFRALQNVNEELKRYNSLLLKLGEAADDEWEAVVAAYRGDLQKPFFEHMQCLIAAAKDDASKRDTLVLLNTRLVALIANHDAVAAEPEKLAAAAELYRDLLSSVSSMEDLDKRMAELSSSGRIDPAFLQISAKAYGAARDTNMSKDEAKWVAYKLYRHARDHFDRQQPAEKRIIEYLLTVTDPTERRNLLDKAITPGPIRMTETHDYLYSTPQRLFLVLDNTLRAYHLMRDGAAKNLNTPEAAVLPRKVRVMMELRDDIIRRYL